MLRLDLPLSADVVFGFSEIDLTPDANQLLIPSCPTPTEGRIMIVVYVGWDAVDAAASGARGDRRAGFP
jgi:hypothetical protein